MTQAQKLLLETLSGHLSLLESAYPRKARTQCARRAKRAIQLRLRQCELHTPRMRLAA